MPGLPPPSMGKKSLLSKLKILKKQITTAIQCSYFAVKKRVAFIITPLLPATKNLLPAHHHNNITYQFVCHCNSRYIVRTSQTL